MSINTVGKINFVKLILIAQSSDLSSEMHRLCLTIDSQRRSPHTGTQLLENSEKLEERFRQIEQVLAGPLHFSDTITVSNDLHQICN